MTRVIRNLVLGEIQTLLDWAAAEGWNPGLDDAVAFQAADPNGFFGAFVDGVMVAGISAVAYNTHFGFIGLYICHPDWRGKGYGKLVWDAGMAYLDDRTIGLDGVPEQQANYAKMGFVAAYETIRMSGTLPARPTGDQELPTCRVGEIDHLDRQCFPAPRDAFLQHWLAPPRRSFAIRADGTPKGYAVRRACRDGFKIGPLFAHTTDVAMEILAAQSGVVHLDVPAAQTEWRAALSGMGFSESFATKRMYRGQAPAILTSFVFGVTSLELG